MNAIEQELKSQNPLDLIKWVLVLVIIIAGVYANSHYSKDYSGYVRALPLIFMAIVAAILALQTAQGQAFAKLVKESRMEIRRVVWPTRQETTQTTLVVAVVVLVMAAVLWMLDWALNQLVSLLIG